MSSAVKKVNMISQIVRLRQVVQRWRSKSNFARRRGSLAVYVGGERRRFVIPTRFLNLPVFVDLLNQAEEEFGFQTSGGLALPCDAGFFAEILRLLDADEDRYARLGVDEFWNQVYGLDFERLSCKETTSSSRAFTPLLTKARV